MFNSKTEQGINFEIFGKIQALMEVYGKECMSRTRVFEWHKKFHERRTEVEDDERSRRPTISKTTTNIREIEKVVREDRRLKGGESSSQFQWFTVAKIELYFLIFFVLILGLRLQRYSTSTKRCPPQKVFGNSEF